jgi:hypothetical protein
MPNDWLAGQKITYLQQHQIQSWSGVPTQFRILLDSAKTLPDMQKITWLEQPWIRIWLS